MSAFVFIDSHVTDAERLLADLPPDIQVVQLNPDSDGIRQIAAALRGIGNLSALHVNSHGAAGVLRLGAPLVDQSALAGYANELTQIGASLTGDSDLLLYGCDVAAGAGCGGDS